MYARMKDTMVSHVETSRSTMFRQATDFVQGKLEDMCATVKSQMNDKVREILDSVFHDYMTVIIGESAGDPANRIPRDELDYAKADVTAVLLSAATIFDLAREGGDSLAEPEEVDMTLEELHEESKEIERAQVQPKQGKLANHPAREEEDPSTQGQLTHDQLGSPMQDSPASPTQDHGRLEVPELALGDEVNLIEGVDVI